MNKIEVGQTVYLKTINSLARRNDNIYTATIEKVGKKYAVIGRFSSLEECENEAILFTKDKLKVVSGFLSEDYKIGYKEGVEHYLASKNDL